MNLEVVDHEILEVTSITTKTQTVVIKTQYDMVYVTDLSYDGVNKKVSASVLKWNASIEGHEIDTAYSQPIVFEYEGNQVEASPVNGVATIDFDVTVSGEHIVKTIHEKMRNGEVVIVV
jgi:hypothetical protein